MEKKLLQLNEKLASDSTLAGQILEKESAEEVQALLKKNDLDFSIEEIQELRDHLIQIASDPAYDISTVPYGDIFQATLELISVSNEGPVTGPHW
ncbi:hypothetical protein [Anoxynatronum buryatiense]|uniref:Uncharacterized protein n=1 Tax=Anoxynatronum buryatiense TaxID=489973 RepID=A0AA45WWR1_9CLOT|nr:hypothetical protein [Anoxynatronum buryatiense]SMP59023.1 hypothetical protein SAMN06296020_107143 [Anoxynatronum buryatiense]